MVLKLADCGALRQGEARGFLQLRHNYLSIFRLRLWNRSSFEGFFLKGKGGCGTERRLLSFDTVRMTAVAPPDAVFISRVDLRRACFSMRVVSHRVSHRITTIHEAMVLRCTYIHISSFFCTRCVSVFPQHYNVGLSFVSVLGVLMLWFSASRARPQPSRSLHLLRYVA